MVSMTTEAAEAMLDQWGESVTYTPRSGAARSIKAIVDRNVPRPVGGPGEGVNRPDLTIEVANRATSIADDGYGGISSAGVDTGGDKVTLPKRIGQAAQDMRIAQVLGQDEAMLTLEVR
jgi:hypothetical protein